MQSKEELRKQKFLMIESWRQSGLSQKAWCSQENISYHIFHYWYRRFRVAQSADKNQRFISLRVQPSSHDASSRIWSYCSLMAGSFIPSACKQ